MSFAAFCTHMSRCGLGRREHCEHCTAMSTSPRSTAGEIIACRLSLCSAANPGSGSRAQKASAISAAAVVVSAQWCAPKMMTRENPIFHTSAVVRLRLKRKSHGSSSPPALPWEPSRRGLLLVAQAGKALVGRAASAGTPTSVVLQTKAALDSDWALSSCRGGLQQIRRPYHPPRWERIRFHSPSL